MQPSKSLRAYLQLEKRMLELDAANDPSADVVRDLMDPLWHQMLEDERALLGERGDYSEILASHGLDRSPTHDESELLGDVRVVTPTR